MLNGADDFQSSLDAPDATSSAPQPIALMAERSRSGEYPTDSLGPVMAAAVLATVKHSYVPTAIAAQSCLAAVSLAVQGHFDVVLPTGQVRPTSLHLVTVAESGDRKSASDDQMMQPIWEYQDSLETEHTARKNDVAMAQAAWDETRKAITQREKSRGMDALETAYRELGPRPEGAVDPTIVVRTGTTQAMMKRFTSCRPSIGLMSDEGGSWLGGYGMTEDNRLLTISTLSDFWDGKSVQINTAGEGFTALRGRRLAFHLMIQPVLAGRLLGNAEAQGQGFLSRLLVAQPESLAGTRFVVPEERDDAAYRREVAPYRERLGQIIAAPMSTLEGTSVLQPRALPLSAQATAMWWAFYNGIEARLGPDGDLKEVKGFVGKLPEQAARIATVLTVFHKGQNVTEVDAKTMARGIALAEFYLTEAVRLFGQGAVNPDLEAAQLLSDWLRDKWKENLISVTAISQHGPSKVRKGGDYVKGLIDILVRHDHLSDRLPNGGMIGGKKARDCWRVLVRHG